jgi:hypothetical protein
MKFVGGDAQMPAVTFTGRTSGSSSVFEVRNSSYSDSTPSFGILASVPWSDLSGKWMRATVEATMLPLGDGGRLKVKIEKADDGKSVLALDSRAGLWRAGNEFMRPKWGVYRQSEHSNIQAGDLNDALVYFDEFCIERAA